MSAPGRRRRFPGPERLSGRSARNGRNRLGSWGGCGSLDVLVLRKSSSYIIS